MSLLIAPASKQTLRKLSYLPNYFFSSEYLTQTFFVLCSFCTALFPYQTQMKHLSQLRFFRQCFYTHFYLFVTSSLQFFLIIFCTKSMSRAVLRNRYCFQFFDNASGNHFNYQSTSCYRIALSCIFAYLPKFFMLILNFFTFYKFLLMQIVYAFCKY